MTPPTRTPSDPLDLLIAERGARRVLFAVFAHILRPARQRPATPQVDHLSDHLRHDIGLGPNSPPVTSWERMR